MPDLDSTTPEIPPSAPVPEAPKDPASMLDVHPAPHAATTWRDLESQLGDLAEELSRPGEVLWGVSALTACGLVIRGVALKGRDLTQGLVTFWRAAKWSLCGRVAAIPRKIY